MKIQGYTQQIGNTNTVSTAIKTVGDVMAYGGDGKGLKSVANAFGQWQEVIAKKQEEDDKQSILQAMDAYNKGRFEIMYNQDNGLMNTVAERANGIDAAYESGMKKLRSNILGNVKLNNQRNMVALQNLMNNSDFEGYKQVAVHQYKQGEVAKDLSLSNNLQNNIELVQMNPGAIDDAFATNALMISLRYSGIQGGEQLAEAKIRQANGQIVFAAIQSYMDKDDYNGAKGVLDKYGHFLTPSQRENVLKGVNASIELKGALNTVNDLFSKYGDNLDAAMKAIDGMKFGGHINSKEDFFNAVSAQESGGDYNAENSRTGAFGKYQIMPDNWSGWAREAGLPEGAAMTPENQEVVAKYKLGQYFDKYGAEGALVAWYAGEGNAKRWVEGAKDAIGENGQHYSWDAKQGAGDEPSIREYVNSALSKGDGTVDDLGAYKRREQLKKLYRNKLADEKRLKDYRLNQQAEEFDRQCYEMANNGTSLEDAIAKARAHAGADSDLLRKDMANINLWYGTAKKLANAANGGSGGKGVKAMNKAIGLELLEKGAFSSANEYCEWVAAQPGANDKDVFDARQNYYEFKQGTGKFSYKELDAVVSDALAGVKLPEGQKNTYKYGIKIYVREQVQDFIMKNNRKPSAFEARKFVDEAMQNVSVGRYKNDSTLFGKDIGSQSYLELSMADRALMGIQDMFLQKDGQWLVYYTQEDGRSPEIMSVDRLAAMKLGMYNR